MFPYIYIFMRSIYKKQACECYAIVFINSLCEGDREVGVACSRMNEIANLRFPIQPVITFDTSHLQ